MMNAYLVLGPESSGTRMMTRLLMAAGCIGDGEHEQRWDTAQPDGETPIVWRKSLPHGGEWPSLDLMTHRLRERGYTVYALVMARDWTAVARSQQEHWGHTWETALDNLRTAYPYIFSSLLKFQVPYVMVSYESLVQHGSRSLGELLGSIGITPPAEFELHDATAQRLQEVTA
jgi:hypothetical protein